MFPKLDTNEERMKKHYSRALMSLLEIVEPLNEIEFELSYYSDYTMDENLKKSYEHSKEVIEYLNRFFEGFSK